MSTSCHSEHISAESSGRPRSFLRFRLVPASRRLGLLLTLILIGSGFLGRALTASAAEWDASVESALMQAGTNRQELVKALERVPAEQRGGMLFLITNMPPRDLGTLPADFLLENVALAYKAAEQAPWAKSIPADIFLNEVLPYASLTEARDNWRKQLYEMCLPLVKDCRTAAEAGHLLNQQIFKLLKVRYSTQRRAAVQGPFETMQSGMATCTGLSILLVDACRSVGVPARIAGTPLWFNNSGNHTWVEIWDGVWHFTGAAEPSPEGLNRGWFVGNASRAIQGDRSHAIYASSFKRTDQNFPLFRSRGSNYVSAVNVTERYTAGAKPAQPSGLQLSVDVFDRPVGERVATQVTITDSASSTVRFEGTSKGEIADMNDHLSFQLPLQRTYVVEAERNGQKMRQYYTAGTNTQDRLAIFLTGVPPVETLLSNRYVPPPVTKPLSAKDGALLAEALTAFFQAPASEQTTWKFPGKFEKMLLSNESAVRKVAWEVFRTAPIHSELKKDFDARQVRFENHQSPYTVKTVGTRPPNGWALFIAMHGGGNAPQALNDSQWRHMQIYYRDHPEAGGYLYVALRAPDNTWNGFYTGYVYPLIQNLLRQFMLFGDVDPNKKFIMGYSHGGYGAFAIGPKMPDYFAAIHASAGAPADGAVPATLRNTVFSCMVGSKDTMYGRYDRIREFEQEIRKLRGSRTDVYPVSVQIIPDHPHSGLPDRDKIADLYPAVRNPVPRELTWRLTDGVIQDFFWLHVPAPTAGQELSATCQGNRLTVTATTNLTGASILLDSRLVDLKKSVVFNVNGRKLTRKIQPSLRTLCTTLQRRGDPELAFTAEIPLPLPGPKSP